MTLREYLALEWDANNSNRKSQLMVYLFRWAWWFRRQNRGWMILGYPYLLFYRVFVEWNLGVELPPLTEVGAGLQIHHGQGLVVNNGTVIGKNCILRHGVTLGNKGDLDPDGCPTLGDGVDVGAGAVVLGRIRLGDGAVVGANAVVLKDVEAGQVVVGNPAKVIAKR